MVKQGYRRSSWSQRHYWRGVPTTRWSRRKASPENLLDHVMFPPCHRIARLFDRVEDLGYRTVDQLVYERLRCPTASAYSPERSSLLETRSVLAEANAFWILTQGRPTSYPGTFRPTTRHVRASARIGHILLRCRATVVTTDSAQILFEARAGRRSPDQSPMPV